MTALPYTRRAENVRNEDWVFSRTPEGPKMYGTRFEVSAVHQKALFCTREQRMDGGRKDEREGGGLVRQEPVAARGLVSGGTTSGAQWWDERSEGVRPHPAYARLPGA